MPQTDVQVRFFIITAQTAENYQHAAASTGSRQRMIVDPQF